MSRSSEEDQEILKNGKLPREPSVARKVRFGDFEVDFEQRELRHRGSRIKLQKKPFQILELLLQKPGAVVTRAQLARRLWPDSHVSFGPGLNTAMNSLREALSDSPVAGRFIETRSGFGYQFVASVQEVSDTQHGSPRSEAQQDYLKGKYLQNKLTEADLGKSIAHFEAAIAEDGRYALSHVGLAETYLLCASQGILPADEARRRAEASILIAFQIDDELAEAHASLASIRALFDWDYKNAEQGYTRALQWNPNYADGRRQYAAFLAAMGRGEEASCEIQRAKELEPLSLVAQVEGARISYMSRQFQECIQQAWLALTLETRFAPAQHLLGLAYEQIGMYDEAIIELENARACSEDNPAMIAALGHAYAGAGRCEEGWGIVRELDASAGGRKVSPYWKSIVYAGLGAEDLAFESIEEACRERDVNLLWLKAEPRFDPLRPAPRFRGLLETIGFQAATQ